MTEIDTKYLRFQLSRYGVLDARQSSALLDALEQAQAKPPLGEIRYTNAFVDEKLVELNSLRIERDELRARLDAAEKK